MPVGDVENEDELYRRVPNAPGMYSLVDGKLRFSSTAFNDRTQKPSVDRAKLRGSPNETKLAVTDGVISLVALEIRAISIENVDAAEGEPPQYSVDVIPRPIPVNNPDGLPENRAHAQVETTPLLASPSRFKKLKEALAILASNREWAIEPS